MALLIAFRYSSQHTASLEAMNYTYKRQFPEDLLLGGHLVETIEINSFGSIYRVTQRLFHNGEIQKEITWIATYGWHSNGHLIEIGGYRYCIFDPEQRTMYLENLNSEDYKTAEVYKQI